MGSELGSGGCSHPADSQRPLSNLEFCRGCHRPPPSTRDRRWVSDETGHENYQSVEKSAFFSWMGRTRLATPRGFSPLVWVGSAGYVSGPFFNPIIGFFTGICVIVTVRGARRGLQVTLGAEPSSGSVLGRKRLKRSRFGQLMSASTLQPPFSRNAAFA